MPNKNDEFNFDSEEFKRAIEELMKSWEIANCHLPESNEEIAERLTKELMERLMLPKKETK